jgi:RNA polymerase sigma-70 factor (sigma-E family)
MGVRPSKREREFREYAVARESQLRRSAYLLSGDWHEAQDLTQTTLMKLYAAWGSVRADGNVDAYARQILARTFIDQQRKGRWREKPYDELPDREAPRHPQTQQQLPDLRLALQDALAQLPPGYRAVLVLRYWEDLSVEQTASALGVAVGTVKSQTARALVRLRELVGEDLVDANEW